MNKCIQIIDGACNCGYHLYAISNEDFAEIFSGIGQDIEFIEDFVARVDEKRALEIMEKTWSMKMDKKNAAGIHGTLFYELEHKKRFYPNKREVDID